MATLPYPGIATDYKPLFTAMLSVADGVGIVTENLFAGRFRYVEELVRLGADIRTDSHHAVVRGVPRLSGAPVKAHDIRAGAAMVVAGLAADGETVISGASHVDRGYDDLVGKLRSVGADVERPDGEPAEAARRVSALEPVRDAGEASAQRRSRSPGSDASAISRAIVPRRPGWASSRSTWSDDAAPGRWCGSPARSRLASSAVN